MKNVGVVYLEITGLEYRNEKFLASVELAKYLHGMADRYSMEHVLSRLNPELSVVQGLILRYFDHKYLFPSNNAENLTHEVISTRLHYFNRLRWNLAHDINKRELSVIGIK